MNPFVLCFVNGTSFFVGLILTAAACAARLRQVHIKTGRVLAAISLAGAVLVVLSGTPSPLGAQWVWLVYLLVILVILDRPPSSRPALGTRRAALLGFLAISLGMGMWELRYHRSPRLDIGPNQTIYVIGDSISAGMRPQEKPWPLVLADISGVRVVNLALAGATTETALSQAKQVKNPNAVVIIEIGGNDLLGDTDARTFRDNLDRLLAGLSTDQHRLVMFELPLPPLSNSYGQAQRDLARIYGVRLIPKRYMTRIIGMKNGTLDGLHLSQAGHNAMAASVRALLNVSRQGSGNTTEGPASQPPATERSQTGGAPRSLRPSRTHP
jgi:acyl-CoA thioesterase I